MSSIKDAFAAPSAFTITLNSLASSNTLVGRVASMIDNTTNLYESALVSVTLKTSATPTANTLAYVFLIRSNNDGTPIIDDNASQTDAAITITNAFLLGSILCPTATANLVLSKTFDTSFLGPLGPKWTIAVVNSFKSALASSGNSASFIGRSQTVA
jgi:hypothetical protein